MNICDRLGAIASFYHREARRCMRGKAYLGAIVMQVAALEAGLQAMCFLFQREVKETATYAKKLKHFRGKRLRALELKLYDLIRIAEELEWFPPKRAVWIGKRRTLAGFSHAIRELRNHVHPGVWARERSRSLRFTKGTYGGVYEVFDVANSRLSHRLEQGILRAMERREKRNPESIQRIRCRPKNR